MRALALTMFLSAAGSLAAEPFLALPIDCTIGTSCFVEDYADIDPSPRALDYACGLKARDGHKGTDFALPDMASMERGVAVRAAAEGVVAASRDGIEDRVLTPDTVAAIQGRECGNAVRIRHANGLQTLYCHLQKGSIAVARGEAVSAGDRLGLVGLSGETTFPHLHFTVLRADGSPVDPFGPDATPATCGTGGGGLWLDPPAYTETGFYTAGFSTDLPDLGTVRDGSARAATARPDDPLVLYGFAFHARTGDVMHIRASGPGGQIFERSIRIDEGRAQLFRAFGRHAPAGGWPPGRYSGDVRLVRGETLVGARQAYIDVVAR